MCSAATGGDVIGIDLGTTNSCVAIMEGKVRGANVFQVVSLTQSLAFPSLTILLEMALLMERVVSSNFNTISPPLRAT